MKTIVLLSGGLDSAVVLAMHHHDECLTLGFDYGQPHLIELDWAERIARHYGTPFERVRVPEMPKINDVVFAGRNLVLASLAVATAQARGYEGIAVGCNASDWLRFPDCRPSFWKALQQCASFYDVRVSMPLIHSSKADVVGMARALDVPVDLTWSCYSPQEGHQCGECLACVTRREAEIAAA